MLLGVLRAAQAGWHVAHQRGRTQEASGFLDECRGTAYGSSNAGALVKVAGLEGLAVLIVGSIKVAPHRHHV